MDHQIDPVADSSGKAQPRHLANGTAASATHDALPAITDGLALEPAGGPDQAVTLVMGDGDNSEWVSSVLRAASLAIIAFQIGYTVLDGGEYPQTFARTLPLHITSMTLAVVALMATLSPRAMRIWRAIALAIGASILAITAWIAAINSDGDVLVATILLSFLGSGALVPWSPRWQAAFNVSGALALLGYSMQATGPDSRLAIAWMVLVSAALLSQLSAVHGARYRRKLAEQLAALAENHRLLRREMELRAQAASARESNHVRLQASESMLRKVFEASPDNIAVNRLSDGRFIAVNDEYRVAGYTRGDVMGNNLLALGLWPNEDEINRFLESIRQTGRVKNMEITQRRKDGSVETNLISASVVEVNGESCVISMIRDITEIKRVERDLLAAREELSRQVNALSASEETFRKLFDANLDSMTLNGVDGKYIDVNQQFTRTTGFSREETIGHHFTELNLWIHPDEMIAFANQLFSTNEVRNVEVAFRCKDGSERPVLISAVNLELYGQLCCLTISREISDLKMTQRELVGAREAALTASRAKSEFLSSMSHEIRTPMNSILGMADLLMETKLDDEQRRYLSTVITNSQVLLQLIDSILDLAKVESGRISLEAVEFDPKDVTEKVLETLAIRAHERGLELMARFAPAVPELALGDPFRLGQILINLVGNAIKFTQHGQVLVLVEPDRSSTTAAGLKFTVTDTGIGIAADKLHLLFNAFTQADSSTSRKYGGSGLGLAIVARLVELMHGKVEVTSEPGVGSAFSFTAQLGAASARTAPAKPRNLTFGDVRILLVDDNSDSRSILSELLTAQGATVTQASSGTEALAVLRSDASRSSCFQIILLDSTMPAPGGFDVAKNLMSGGPAAPQIVMMLSTNDLTSKVGRLRAIGVDHYIVKPVRRAELFAAVARACDGVCIEPRGDRFASPAIAPISTASAILDRPLQILLADDSQDNRALIRAYLKKTPYRLEEAEDGQQAIDKFIAGKFDLVLMDIRMPIVDGYQATSRIRGWERANHRRRTPIVALTASALEEAAHRTKAAGCDAHVTKPVKKSTLLDAIRGAIEANPLDDEPARLINRNLKEATCQTE
ncbi:MAG: response regulator [Candidatus Binatus sp.]|uniref:response regulator n=1 Tax=Candidatus Binatus sp. TaxID=2811406 RepID=UPI003D10F067